MWVIIFILATLIGWFFPVGRGINFSDIMFVVLAAVAAFNLAGRRWKMDAFFKYVIGYSCLMLLASFINESYGKTVFLNYFRIFFQGSVMYVCVYNSLTSRKRLRLFVACLGIFLIYFFVKSREIMTQSYFVEYFVSLTFGYGRNNWGFTCLLLFILAGFMAYYRIAPRWLCVVLLPVFFAMLFFSASRLALLCALASIVVFRLWTGRVFSLKELVIYMMLGVGAWIALTMASSVVDLNIVADSQGMLERKMAKAGEDAMDTRVMNLNVIPMIEMFQTAPWYTWVFGDGISIKHGILAQLMLGTGVVGTLYFLWFNLRLILDFRRRRVTQWASWLMLVMLVNDFVTNARFIIGINCMFFMLMCAFIVKYEQLKEAGVLDGDAHGPRWHGAKRHLPHQGAVPLSPV